MATLHLLGTGSVVSDPHRTTTMLAVDNDESLLLVDCGGDAVQRMRECGLDPLRLKRMIITHEHADHVAGFPLLLERLWVHGLRGTFHVHGIRPALEQARRVHDAFNTRDWPDYPVIEYHEVGSGPGEVLLEEGGWRVESAPGDHPVPCVGLRFTDMRTGARMFYSADTEPAPAISELAAGVPLLVHEATGHFPGHSTAMQAAELARSCGSERLILVHVPPDGPVRQADVAAARELFPATEIADEGGSCRF